MKHYAIATELSDWLADRCPLKCFYIRISAIYSIQVPQIAQHCGPDNRQLYTVVCNCYSGQFILIIEMLISAYTKCQTSKKKTCHIKIPKCLYFIVFLLKRTDLHYFCIVKHHDIQYISAKYDLKGD